MDAVDGNAIGGLLIDVFGAEMTAASSTYRRRGPAVPFVTSSGDNSVPSPARVAGGALAELQFVWPGLAEASFGAGTCWFPGGM